MASKAVLFFISGENSGWVPISLLLIISFAFDLYYGCSVRLSFIPHVCSRVGPFGDCADWSILKMASEAARSWREKRTPERSQSSGLMGMGMNSSFWSSTVRGISHNVRNSYASSSCLLRCLVTKLYSECWTRDSKQQIVTFCMNSASRFLFQKLSTLMAGIIYWSDWRNFKY